MILEKRKWETYNMDVRCFGTKLFIWYDISPSSLAEKKYISILGLVYGTKLYFQLVWLKLYAFCQWHVLVAFCCRRLHVSTGSLGDYNYMVGYCEYCQVPQPTPRMFSWVELIIPDCCAKEPTDPISKTQLISSNPHGVL